MKTKKKARRQNPLVLTFRKDVKKILGVAVDESHTDLVLPDYPFDAQALSLSELYRISRKLFVESGGRFEARMCSVTRSLSALDLFASSIEYSPIESEIIWFNNAGFREVADPEFKVKTFRDLNGVSMYHEQNHRIVWAHLPPAPTEQLDLFRYLNFAESIVIALDLAMADQIGKKLSPSFERMKTIYRTGGEDKWSSQSKDDYRNYLHGTIAATYFLLELYKPADIGMGLNQIFPNQKKMVKDVVKRSLDLSDLFVLNTNQLWQDRYWMFAQDRLAEMHHGTDEGPLYLPEDPNEFGTDEFAIADQILAKFGL